MGQVVPDSDLPDSSNVVPDSDLPDHPSVATAPAGPPRFTPSQLLDPNNVAAIDKAYGLHRPGAETVAKIGNWVSQAPKKAGDVAQNLAVKAGANPWGAAAIGEGTELGVNALEMLPFGVSGARGLKPSAESPFAAEEAAETQRLSDIHDQAAARNLDIPESANSERIAKAASNNQSISDNIVRKNFGLSEKAPLTPQMMDAWRSKFAANSTYAEARAIPDVQLSPEAANDLGALPQNLKKSLNLDLGTIQDGHITGDQAVDLSRALRAKSSNLWKAAKFNPAFEDDARAIDQTVDSLEGSVGKYLQNPAQWAVDRAHIAQSYDVQSALDSGHIDVHDLARMKYAKGAIKPWSGDISMLADMGNLHPDAFTLTRTPLPKYGMLRKGLAFGAGVAAAQGAAKLGLGAISHAVGQQATNVVAPE